MVTKYLYIDDEARSSLESYIRAVEGGEEQIQITFDDQIMHLLVVLNNYDGLILDWQLDDIPHDSGKRVLFRAGSLAQEIRTKGTSHQVKELPIILWSTKPKLRRSYFSDKTSHDLFDVLYDKGDVVDRAAKVRKEILSLVRGYERLTQFANHATTFNQVLGVTEEDYKLLNSRFVGHFTRDRSTPTHEYAGFLLKEVLLRPGVVIGEELLAARLGVNSHESSEWKSLLAQLPKNTEYRGPFCEAWHRWWTVLVEKVWWRSLSSDLPSLSVLNANERVAKLKEYTGLQGLVAATPMAESYGDRFQTICEVSRQPLDPIDGVVMDEKERLPWQERRYLSVDAALERRGQEEELRPHPSEFNRLKEIKESRSEDAEV